MKCEQIKELLVTARSYEDMSAEEQRQLQTHLAACAACRQEMAGLATTRRMLSQWAVETPQDALVQIPTRTSAGWAARVQQIFDAWLVPAARLSYRAVMAGLVIVGCLSLLHTEIAWDQQGKIAIAFHTFWTPRPSPTSGGPTELAESKLSEADKDWVQARIMDGQTQAIKVLADYTDTLGRMESRDTQQQLVSLKYEMQRLGKRVAGG